MVEIIEILLKKVKFIYWFFFVITKWLLYIGKKTTNGISIFFLHIYYITMLYSECKQNIQRIWFHFSYLSFVIHSLSNSIYYYWINFVCIQIRFNFKFNIVWLSIHVEEENKRRRKKWLFRMFVLFSWY